MLKNFLNFIQFFYLIKIFYDFFYFISYLISILTCAKNISHIFYLILKPINDLPFMNNMLLIKENLLLENKYTLFLLENLLLL